MIRASLSLSVSLLLLSTHDVFVFVAKAFVAETPQRPSLRRWHPARFYAVPPTEDDDNEVISGPESSRMNNYIADFLGKTRESSPAASAEQQPLTADNLATTSTHLVAIPMDTNHELLLELESVQRAILYHCPILVDACIPGARTRLPLLYVRAPPTTNSALVTSYLADTLQELVNKHIFQTLQEDEEDDDYDEDWLNADGYRPFTMTFQSLEIDGSNNSILSTVGLSTDKSTQRLGNLVQDLQDAIHARGWQSCLPPDPQEKTNGDDDNQSFRPRIPFMQLPKEFDDNLDRFKDESTEISTEDSKFLTSDQGGNGISPIFWCQWWDDVFGRNVRLKEIAVYPRTVWEEEDGNGNTLQGSFFIPHETVAFPDANDIMLESEKKFEKYQDERLEEERQRIFEAGPGGGMEALSSDASSNSSSSFTDPDIIMRKTRKRLEELYINSGEEDKLENLREASQEEALGMASQESSQLESAEEEDEEEDESLDLPESIGASPDDFIDDWMKDRIRNIVENRDSVKSRSMSTEAKDKPPIADNPVFKAYKAGTLVPKKETMGQSSYNKELPPYPSREHFVGIWRVVTSPTGLPPQETSEDESENLILRVDGSIAGGPLLDPETKQKAAGGTWKMFVEEDGKVQLRIRLVVPPKKERVLEMFGSVDRLGSGAGSIPMASKTFGIPFLEEKAKQANKGGEEMMYCGGDVFMEDAITKKNRENIGTFSLLKVKGPLAKGDYTITIPRPIRNQD